MKGKNMKNIMWNFKHMMFSSIILVLCQVIAVMFSFQNAAANVSLRDGMKFLYESGYGATAVASSLSARLISEVSSGNHKNIKEISISKIWAETEKEFLSVAGKPEDMKALKDKDGSTLLMQVVKFSGKEKGDKEIRDLHNMLVKSIIDMGVDVNARNNQGKTALTHAREYDLQEIIKMLKQAGARE